ncbi:MAG: hypothetical protein NZO58_08025 [Gemmataceae bacterium]|nr:hypothetical protein [Gemmataceae bacterium]
MAQEPKGRPLVRGQAPEPSPVVLDLPSPEQLGIVISAPMATPGAQTDLDWNVVQQRLRRLGAVEFHLVRIAPEQWRATFLLPINGGKVRLVESKGVSDAAAVAAALDQAEAWLAPGNAGANP